MTKTDFSGFPKRVILSTTAKFVNHYWREVVCAWRYDSAVEERIADAIHAIEQCRDSGGTVYACGNGGSWATAAHLVCDLAKTPQGYKGPRVSAVCLGANPSLVTATANDVGYGTIFTEEIWQRARPPDVFVGISASGNSPNVLDACNAARDVGLECTIGLTGFHGGALARMVDISIHVPSNHYGIIEDCHMIICHAIAYFLAGERRT